MITVRVTSSDMDVSIGLETIEDMEMLDKVVAKVRNQLARPARPSLETKVRCEQCKGARYVSGVPCSACNAMGESPALNRGVK